MAHIEGSLVVETRDEVEIATTSLVLRSPDRAAAVHIFFESTEAIDRTIGSLISLKRLIGEAADRNEKPVDEGVPA